MLLWKQFTDSILPTTREDSDCIGSIQQLPDIARSWFRVSCIGERNECRGRGLLAQYIHNLVRAWLFFKLTDTSFNEQAIADQKQSRAGREEEGSVI